MRKAFRMMLVALAASGAGAAAQSQERLQIKSGTWTVDYGEYRCTLARRTGSDGSSALILSYFLDRQAPQMLLVRDGSEQLPALPSRIGIVLDPGNQREEVRAVGYSAEVGPAFRIEGLSENFVDRFSASRSMRIDAGGRALLTVPIPGARQAVDALRACNDNLMSAWDIDVAARATYSRAARIVAGSLNSSDYPGAALRARLEGVVVARYTVSAQGRVSDCRVVASSRVPALDEATCLLVSRRWRYEPALDAEGNPIATTEIQTVSWRLTP